MKKHLNDKKIDQYKPTLKEMALMEFDHDFKRWDLKVTDQENKQYLEDDFYRKKIDACGHDWVYRFLFSSYCKKCGHRMKYLPPDIVQI